LGECGCERDAKPIEEEVAGGWMARHVEAENCGAIDGGTIPQEETWPNRRGGRVSE
jgi:hypothetical protein